MSLGLAMGFALVMSHDGHNRQDRHAHLAVHESDDMQAAWAAVVVVLVFLCMVSLCVGQNWSSPAPEAGRYTYLTHEHAMQQARRMQEDEQRRQQRRSQQENEATMVAMMGQIQAQAAQVPQVPQAGVVPQAGLLAQAQAMASAALPDGAQLRDKGTNDVYVLHACICGRNGQVALRLDSKYRGLDAAQQLVATGEMVQWPYKVQALTYTKSTKKLQIKCTNWEFVIELDDENEQRALEHLPALARATRVAWVEKE